MTPPTSVTIIECDDDDRQEPTFEQVIEYAEFIGIDPETEPHLLWIAREGVMAPVPPPWKMCTENGSDESDVFYFNFQTGESVWDHPCDEKYRELLEECREKEGKDMTGLLSPETLCGLREAEAAGMRLCIMPSIDEVSCEAEESYSNFSTCDDSSDVEDMRIEEKRRNSSPRSTARSPWEEACASDSSDGSVQEDVPKNSAKDDDDDDDAESDDAESDDDKSNYSESIAEEAEALQKSLTSPSSPQREAVEDAVDAPETDDIDSSPLGAVKAELSNLVKLLGDLREVRGVQQKNLEELYQLTRPEVSQ